MKSYLLGIDIGTSECKVAVFDRNGKVLAAAVVTIRYIIRRKDGQNRIRKNGGMLSAGHRKKQYRKQILSRMRLRELESMGRAGLR